tara:strand:- start:1062 stop:1478 length:417 start_codon:yes stop_codon:yes gene_type:complete
MRMYVYEVFEDINKAQTKKEKVAILKENETWALKDIIKGSMDPNIKWHLPAGEVPYTPSQPHNAPSNLKRQNTKFSYFAKGGKGEEMPQYKREKVFLGIVESIHPKDAELMVNMINKKTPEGVTKAVIQEAFPGLISE